MGTISLASIVSLLWITIIISFPPHCRSQNDSHYYELCHPYKCGDINFTFPFSSRTGFGNTARDCGLPGYSITCDPSQVSRLELSGKLYQVKRFFLAERQIMVFDDQLVKDLRRGSCDSLKNFTNTWPLQFPPWPFFLDFVLCPLGLNLPNTFLEQVKNYSCGENYRLYFFNTTSPDDPQLSPPGLAPIEIPSVCTYVRYPVSRASVSRYKLLSSSNGDPEKLIGVLDDGFQLQWPDFVDCNNCEKTGGRCGFDGSLKDVNSSSIGIVCFCGGPRGGCNQVGKVDQKYSSRRWKLIVGVTTGSVILVVAIAVSLAFKFKWKALLIFKLSYFKRKISFRDGQNVEQFIKNYQSTLPTKYSYADIKKMTNEFREKLGEGGYGNVFKGKLPNGHFVAAKMLEKTSNNSQDFVNEVATIGRIHHLNVIRLLGFCWEGSKRALIYEFMSNGSLGDLISKEEVSHSLGWEKLLEIAIGVAHGIEYLHNGCDSRILHLDIKPHNVLLDHNLHPKISDFGLAKSHSRNDSVVPLTGARGTVGYVAPEVFLRNLGGVSHKSDVYSYGMLLLEMVGGRKNVEMQASTSAYFPDSIYNKLIQEEDMDLIDIVVEEEVFIARKMVMVGLWCIQINPRDRPSITTVVEMLSGSVEAIGMPPKPSFSSPPLLQHDHEVFSTHSDSSVLPLTSESA